MADVHQYPHYAQTQPELLVKSKLAIRVQIADNNSISQLHYGIHFYSDLLVVSGRYF